MRIFMTGWCGMLSHAVLPMLVAHGHQVTTASREALDVTDGAAVRLAVQKEKPDWVCHLAAYTDVDGCESNEAHAMRVNGEGAGNAASAAAAVGAAVLSISTDYVFAGDDPSPRRETDPTGPLSAYGRSKLAGELAVRAANPRHTIVRTAWLYGSDGKNFVDTIRERALGGHPLKVVDDQRGSPTWTDDLARTILELMERGATGTFHATNEGSCTWYEFAQEICRLSGANVPIEPISSDRLARPAKRPAFSVLDTSKLRKLLGRPMPPWRDALAEYLEEVRKREARR